MFNTPATTSSKNLIVLMREPEMVKSGAFIEFAKRYRPCQILDLRLFPRLDFFAGSRIRTFKFFEELQIEYLDFFGREATTSNDSDIKKTLLILDFLHSLLIEPTHPKGPIILFFDNDNLLSECKKKLSSHINETYKTTIKADIGEYKSGFLSMQFR